MKKRWIVAALAACAIALVGCKIVLEPEPIAVQSVTLNETTLTLEYGDTKTLTATVLPENADNRTVTWYSSTPEVADVDYWGGVVTAHSEGTTTISAYAGSRMASCEVTVKRKEVAVDSITLNADTLTLVPAESRILTATAHPYDADDKTATWSSSDTSVAMVDSNGISAGIVTAIGPGTAIITAQIGDCTALCTVYVNETLIEQPDNPVAVEVESITLNTSTLMLEPNTKSELIATVTPDDADDKMVTWRTSDYWVATVDNYGTVTTHDEGTATITAQAGGKTAECVVTVKHIANPVTGVMLDKETLTLTRGAEFKLTAMVTPSNADYTYIEWTCDSSPDWSVLDFILRDNPCAVAACGIGTATITATTREGGFTATCEVTVLPKPIESITFASSTLSLGRGDTGDMNYSLMPIDFDYVDGQALTWSSSDETIATVNTLGKVTAHKAGKATITATALAGGKTATYDVIVHEHSYKDGKCTVCGKNPYMSSGTIDENGVLTKVDTTSVPVNLVIPDGVTGIGDNAFKHFSGLTNVTIPDSVKKIGNNAFYACYNLTSITIPVNVTSIGNYAFYDCIKLSEVTIPCGVSSIGDCAFLECGGLKSVTIANGVTSIGSRAFESCRKLDGVAIPASVKSIGSDAFKDCMSLTEIKFSGTKAQWNAIKGSDEIDITCILCSDGHIGVKDVPEYLTMSGRTVTGVIKDKLPANLVIPDGVREIRSQAFYMCSGLTSVTIPNSVTNIGNVAFSGCTSLTSITIPDSVTSIGYSAFSSCKSLTGVTIPGSVTSIGYSAFAECTSLMSITIPASVTSIGRSVFWQCTKLNSVRILASVTSIEECTFYGCTSLTSVTIPDSVTSIGDSAFYGCTSLTDVTIPNSVTTIGDIAFYKCDKLTTVTYKGTKAQWEAISKAEGFTTIGSFTVRCTDGDVVVK